MIPVSLYVFILIELIFVSIGDFRTKKIPNYWSLLNIILFILLLFFFKDMYVVGWRTFLYPVIWIIVGFLFFILKIMGGGDSKFLATYFLLIPLAKQDDAFYYLIISTLYIGLTVFFINIVTKRKLIFNSLATKDYKALKKCFGTKFTFAPVIFISWVMLGWDLKIF